MGLMISQRSCIDCRSPQKLGEYPWPKMTAGTFLKLPLGNITDSLTSDVPTAVPGSAGPIMLPMNSRFSAMLSIVARNP